MREREEQREGNREGRGREDEEEEGEGDQCVDFSMKYKMLIRVYDSHDSCGQNT